LILGIFLVASFASVRLLRALLPLGAKIEARNV
jgi:hypothetical protein